MASSLSGKGGELMKKSPELIIAVLLITGTLPTAFLGMSNGLQTPTIMSSFFQEEGLPNYLLLHNGSGVFSVVSAVNGEKLSEEKIEPLVRQEVVGKKMEKVVVKTETNPKNEVKVDPAKATHKGYQVVEISIFPGDNSWRIQESLTPNKDVATMLREVKAVNGGQEMHPIYPGKTYKFLKEVLTVSQTKEEVQEEVVEEIVEKEVIETKTAFIVSSSEVDGSFAFATEGKVGHIQMSKDGEIQEQSFAYDTNDVSGVKKTMAGLMVTHTDGTNHLVSRAGKITAFPTASAYAFANNVTAIAYGEQLVISKINEEKSILLSREVQSMVIEGDQLFILTEASKEKSLLVIIDLTSSAIIDFLEIGSAAYEMKKNGENIHIISPTEVMQVDTNRNAMKKLLQIPKGEVVELVADGYYLTKTPGEISMWFRDGVRTIPILGEVEIGDAQ